MGHYFEVKPNDLASSFLAIEDYYREGRASRQPQPDVDEGEIDEPFDEEKLRRLVERDPY